ASGYETKKMPVSIAPFQNQNVDVKLAPKDISIEDQQETSFNIYPNPATDEFYININKNGFIGNLQIRIYNSKGEMIRADKRFPKQGEIQVLTTDLPSGVYLVQIQDNHTSYIQKLIIE
ncbi:MAG: T9SS type A sorting domain-containing protein, partial [Bacteroidota bacterium]